MDVNAKVLTVYYNIVIAKEKEYFVVIIVYALNAKILMNAHNVAFACSCISLKKRLNFMFQF